MCSRLWARPGSQLKLVGHIVSRDKEVVGAASLQQAQLQLSLDKLEVHGACCWWCAAQMHV